jgi:hypothetical protein
MSRHEKSINTFNFCLFPLFFFFFTTHYTIPLYIMKFSLAAFAVAIASVTAANITVR